MSCKNLLIILRYIALCLMGYSILVFPNNRSLFIFLFLILVINNQIRLFKFYKDESLSLVSIFIELLLSSYISSNLDCNFAFFTIPSILDSFFMLTKERSYTSLFVTFLTFLIFQLPCNLYYFLENITIISIVLIFSIYIKVEIDNKIYIQELSNKLRISQGKIKDTNKRLEKFKTSIDQLEAYKDRTQLSKDIYNSVEQSLSAIIVQLGAIEHIASKEDSSAKNLIINLKTFTNSFYKDIRKSIRKLKPTTQNKYQWSEQIDDLGKYFTKITGIQITINLPEEKIQLPSSYSNSIYKIIQDFFCNSLKIGQSSGITINFSIKNSQLLLNIQDSSSQYDYNSLSKSINLSNVTEILTPLNGTAHYTTSSEKGFSLDITLPYVQNQTA